MQPQTDQPLVAAASSPQTEGVSWSARMADSMLRRHPVGRMRWRYEDGFLLTAIERLWRQT